MSPQALAQATERFAGTRMTVVGDLMVDAYLWGDATRISPEAPVMVVEVERESAVPGGAANVANNLLALGAEVSVVGVCGADDAGDRLVADLAGRGADVRGIVRDSSRPTTVKTRVVTQGQQVVRIDRETREPISGEVEEELVRILRTIRAEGQSVIVSDYAKGAVTHQVARAALAQGKGITAVNAKPRNGGLYRDADMVTVNQVEAEAMSGTDFRSEEHILEHGTALRERLGIRSLVVTRGGKGMIAFQEGREPIIVPAKQVEVYDVAGAGDTVITTLALTLASGSDLVTASHLAMRAAAIVVGKLGVATVSRDELVLALASEGIK